MRLQNPKCNNKKVYSKYTITTSSKILHFKVKEHKCAGKCVVTLQLTQRRLKLGSSSGSESSVPACWGADLLFAPDEASVFETSETLTRPGPVNEG